MNETKNKPTTSRFWWLRPSKPQLRRARKIRQILDCLAEEGELSYGKLSERTGIPKSTVRDCLKVVRGGHGLRLMVRTEAETGGSVEAGCEQKGVSL